MADSPHTSTDNPLSELIGYLKQYLPLLEKGLSAENVRVLSNTRQDLHFICKALWARFRERADAERDLFIAAAPFLRQFPGDRQTIEDAISIVCAGATLRITYHPGLVGKLNERGQMLYERQRSILDKGKSTLAKLEQLAALWPIDSENHHRKSTGAKKRTKKTEARDKWIYEQCCKGIPHENIVAELRRKAVAKGWRIVSTKQRIRQIGIEYADDNGLGRPSARQNL